MQAARVRIKICGLRDPAQARAAAVAGVDAIGLNFHPASPRAVDIACAQAICAALPPFVVSVGLFVNADATTLRAVLDQVPLQMLQFHGDEDEAECLRWDRPYLKALRVRPGMDLERVLKADYASAAGILLDTYRKGVPGGTGAVFDWDCIPAEHERALVLAGGLNADNVGPAIRQVRPWAVDVSGGVEREPGVKDPAAMLKFVRAVRAASNGEGCT